MNTIHSDGAVVVKKGEKTMKFRQVHLDFHTSGAIDGIGSAFNKEQFQAALKAGHVNSITLFSKCHHGYAYHPSEANEMHPGLSFDLLGAEIEACREIGVNTPVYLSAGLDEKLAVRHPEWLCLYSPALMNADYLEFKTPGYHLLCFNTPYLDILCAQIEEVMRRYHPVGIFLDICAPRDCTCEYCKKRMLERGMDPNNPADVKRNGIEVYEEYCSRTNAVVRKYNPDATIFHNGGHICRGQRKHAAFDTHHELESLPTGGWGYDHFPISASYTRTLGYDYLGMTGKFHTTWGEFGGFKHPNALRYEAGLNLAFGAKMSIGDQAHPTVKLNMATYELIGAAYAEVEAKEAWCDHVKAVTDVAILSHEAFSPSGAFNDIPDTGAARMLLEGKYLFDVIDQYADLTPYKILVLPDGIRFDEELAGRIRDYLAKGGKILATGASCLKKDKDEFAVDLGAEMLGKSEFKPSYFVPTALTPDIAPTEYVMYTDLYNVRVTSGRCFARSADPYFNRTAEHFCSHQHTPNRPGSEREAGVLTENVCYIGWDIFNDYATKGELHNKKIFLAAMDALLGESKTLSTSLPDRGIVTLNEQPEQNRLVNHLLFTATSVRGTNTEVIEDVIPLYDVKVAVRLDKAPKRVYLAPQNADLPYEYKGGVLRYTVPKLELHQMVVIDR